MRYDFRTATIPPHGGGSGGDMPLRMRVHDREPIGAALRRFKKLLERSGLLRQLRKRKYYEKPCELRRRAKHRKLSAIRKGMLQTRKGTKR
jgi:small subunit ribosomal protein S21